MAATQSGKTLTKTIPLLSKFEGAMVGAVLGDCMGAAFEYKYSVTIDDINGYFAEIKQNNSDGRKGGEWIVAVDQL